jgi:hypothetical protein
MQERALKGVSTPSTTRLTDPRAFSVRSCHRCSEARCNPPRWCAGVGNLDQLDGAWSWSSVGSTTGWPRERREREPEIREPPEGYARALDGGTTGQRCSGNDEEVDFGRHRRDRERGPGGFRIRAQARRSAGVEIADHRGARRHRPRRYEALAPSAAARGRPLARRAIQRRRRRHRLSIESIRRRGRSGTSM